MKTFGINPNIFGREVIGSWAIPTVFHFPVKTGKEHGLIIQIVKVRGTDAWYDFDLLTPQVFTTNRWKCPTF